MSVKPKLMWRRAKPTTVDIVKAVAQEASKAADLAQIAGQDKLTDPCTNPAVREHANHLRNKEHEQALNAAYARKMRRHRMESRRAEYAERVLEAIQAAKESRSPAKSVLFLHARRNLYMRTSLVTSVALAAGSAMGLEQIADRMGAPTGTGFIGEVGLTWLATMVIQARADLAQHGGAPSGWTWRNTALWVLMVAPLAASMAANIHGHNVLGALCAAGAAAFSFFSYIISDLFAVAARRQAKQVTGDEAKELRGIVSGSEVPAQPRSSGASTEMRRTDVKASVFGPVKPTMSATVVESPEGQVTDPAGGHGANRSLPQGATPEMTRPTGQVTPGPATQVTPESPAQATGGTAVRSPGQVTAKSDPAPQAKSRVKGSAESRRTDEELKADLQVIVAEHYRNNPGEEIKVLPVAKQLRIGRDRARRLLDEMSVRPMRKAANQ